MKFKSGHKEWLCVDLPTVEYTHALDLQHRLITTRNHEIIHTNLVLILEHAPVFTIGLRGGLANLNVSETFLAQKKIKIVRSERGGDITFHGPGQLVVYPVIDLRKLGIKMLDYVRGLEEIMIRVAADWGIKARRNAKNRGIWVNDSKLGSIGIAVRRGIAFHGLALNVDPSLKPFEWIHPCGIRDCSVTSMARELSLTLSVDQVREAVKRHIQAVFGVRLVATGLPELQEMISDFSPELETI